MIDLFDIQVELGYPPPGCKESVGAGELRTEMVRLSIGRALVRMGPENFDQDVLKSNARLFEMCAVDRALVPCPVLLPNSARDLDPEEVQVAQAVERGAGAAFIRPVHDAWLLDDWVSAPLFEALQARRLPVYCLERMVPVSELARLAGRYPDLPFILAEAGYRQQRTYLPLLETFPNVWISTGNNHITWLGLEQIVRTLGPERLLFGTGFPAAEAMAAVTMLLYAGLSGEEEQCIGAGNMDRLMEGIVR